MSDEGTSGPAVDTVRELFAGKYEVVSKLGWNGLAPVYQAKKMDGASVAIAVLPIDTESSAEATALFKSTAAELQLFVEPGVVRVSGHGIQHGVPYLELEYVDATTLADELEDGPLERDQALSLTSELLDTLGRAHAQGHFHWDLTPSNILLAPGMDGSEHASVVGFGIQQIIRAAFDPEKTGPTGRGSGPQARRYLPPELLDASSPDARADVFSVAAVLHHMLTGTAPGSGSAAAPDDLATALATAMSDDPADRPANAAALGFALAEGASGQRGEKPSFAPPENVPAPFTAPSVPAAALPPSPAPKPAPEPTPAPAAPEPEAEATVMDAMALLEEELAEEALEDAVAAAIAKEEEEEARAAELAQDAAPPAPHAPPAPPAAPVPPASPPAPSAADYESLGPPASPAADALGLDLDAAMAAAPSLPAAAPSSLLPGAETPSPAVASKSSPADPFAPAGVSANPQALSPYDDGAFAEEEKKKGSAIAAIIVLVIAVGLVVTFFMVR